MCVVKTGQGYGSYGSAQGMGGFANQQSQHSQTPQYQSYGDSSTGTPTAGVTSSKQPAYDSYSNYNSFSQPSFGGQKADLYSSQAAQPQVSLSLFCTALAAGELIILSSHKLPPSSLREAQRAAMGSTLHWNIVLHVIHRVVSLVWNKLLLKSVLLQECCFCTQNRLCMLKLCHCIIVICYY